jgi:hypothetical protein
MNNINRLFFVMEKHVFFVRKRTSIFKHLHQLQALDRQNCIIRSFMIRIFHQDKIKAAVMGGAHGKHRTEKK